MPAPAGCEVYICFTFLQMLLTTITEAKITAARFYLSAQNLATFTKYTGFDPEVSANGIDLNVYPVTRTLSAGLSLTF